MIEPYYLPRRMAITEPCGKQPLDPIFREAAKSFSGNEAVLSAELPSFALGDCLEQDTSHVGLGYPNGAVNDEEPNSLLIEAVVPSLHGAERRAFGKVDES